MANVISITSKVDDEARIDAALAKAKEEHGDGKVVAVETVRGWAIFRTPTFAEISRYRALLFDDKTKKDATDVLARQVVIYPDPVTFDAWCTECGLIPLECSSEILTLAGLTGKAATKK